MHVLYSFPLRLGTSGTGMTAWHQVTGLLGQGVRVTLYTGSCEESFKGLDGLKETLKPLGVKLPIRLLGVNRGIELHDRIVARAIRQIHMKWPIDIIHCWPSGAKETLKSARQLGIKTVLERPSAHTRYVYEMTSRECEKLGMKLKKSHYAAYKPRRLIREESEFRLADKLLCPSEFVAKTFLERGFNDEQLARHRYGCDIAVFRAANPNQSRSDNSPFTVVYVGECNPLKGLHFALKAWVKSAASKNGKFYICGAFVPQYKRLLKQFLVHPSVKYLGFVQDTAKVMCQSDALILPSLAEGSALVTYEARACGCVLLVSEAAGAVCEHMRDALVHAPGDVDTLRAHIDLLATDTKMLAHLRENSFAGVSELTWEKAAQSLVAVYQQCLGEGEKAQHS